MDHEGQKLFKDSEGQFVRQNKEGEWEQYDPSDGLALKVNPETGELEKYDENGFIVEKDQFGNIKRYDEDNNICSALPGGLIVRHD